MKSKIFILLTLLLGMLACGVATPTPTAEPVAEPDMVEEEKPVIIPTATFTPEPEEEIIKENPSPALSEVEGCVELLTPENEIEFGESAKVTFSWTAMDDATNYILIITLPSEDIVIFESEETEITRYIEAFTQDGEYQWNLTALNATGEEICSSDFFTFTKPQTPENKPQGDGGGGGGEEGPPDWQG